MQVACVFPTNSSIEVEYTVKASWTVKLYEDKYMCLAPKDSDCVTNLTELVRESNENFTMF